MNSYFNLFSRYFFSTFGWPPYLLWRLAVFLHIPTLAPRCSSQDFSQFSRQNDVAGCNRAHNVHFLGRIACPFDTFLSRTDYQHKTEVLISDSLLISVSPPLVISLPPLRHQQCLETLVSSTILFPFHSVLSKLIHSRLHPCFQTQDHTPPKHHNLSCRSLPEQKMCAHPILSPLILILSRLSSLRATWH